MYLSGYTLYRLEAIGVFDDPNQPKVRIKSELNFPLHTWLAGGELQYTFPISKGHAFSVSAEIYTNIGNDYGQMTDQDWIDGIQIAYTEAQQTTLEALYGDITLKYHFFNTTYSGIYLLGRLLYQRFDLKNQEIRDTGAGWLIIKAISSPKSRALHPRSTTRFNI
jgi:hypothetical protein